MTSYAEHDPTLSSLLATPQHRRIARGECALEPVSKRYASNEGPPFASI